MNTKVVLGITLLLFLTGCTSTTYVCYDGSQAEDAEECPTIPTADISEREAKRSVDNLGQAYASSRNVRYNFINLYQEEGDYMANILFSDVRSQEEHQMTIRIDGETGSPECQENCGFFNRNDINRSIQ